MIFFGDAFSMLTFNAGHANSVLSIRRIHKKSPRTHIKDIVNLINFLVCLARVHVQLHVHVGPSNNTIIVSRK